MRALVVSMCATAAVTACSLITPLGDLGGSDGGLDSSSNDGPPVRFCLTVDAQFCDDFDDSDGSTFAHWTTTTAQRGGTLDRTPSDATAPSALRSSLPGWPDASSPEAFLTRTFVAVPSSWIRVAFDMRVLAFGAQASNGLTIHFSGAIAKSDVHLALAAVGSTLEEANVMADGGTTYVQHDLAQNFIVGQWHHVQIDATVATPIVVQVTVDGALWLGPSKLAASITVTGLYIQAGSTYEDPGNGLATLDTDNVVVGFQ